MDIIEDGRLIGRKTGVRSPFGDLVPLHCGNCGVEGGLVSEKATERDGCTFAAWLCPKCEKQWGPLYGTMATPDEVVMKKMQEAMMNEFGRILTEEELLKVVEANSSPLATLILKGR